MLGAQDEDDLRECPKLGCEGSLVTDYGSDDRMTSMCNYCLTVFDTYKLIGTRATDKLLDECRARIVKLMEDDCMDDDCGVDCSGIPSRGCTGCDSYDLITRIDKWRGK